MDLIRMVDIDVDDVGHARVQCRLQFRGPALGVGDRLASFLDCVDDVRFLTRSGMVQLVLQQGLPQLQAVDLVRRADSQFTTGDDSIQSIAFALRDDGLSMDELPIPREVGTLVASIGE